MIPQFNQSDVLPPFRAGSQPTDRGDVSPYKVTFAELVSKFSFSRERVIILNGFVDYCKRLESIGITDGIQWIDGSFTEDVEKGRGRPPSDIDLVTLVSPPNGMTRSTWENVFRQNLSWILPPGSKQQFKCDAYLIDLSAHPNTIVSNTCYWFGLFTHQRKTYIWKGILQLELKEVLDSINNGIQIGGQNA